MVVHEITTSDLFNAKLENGLDDLASQGLDKDQIQDIKDSAHFIMASIYLKLARLRTGMPFEKVKDIFDRLVETGYTPHLFGKAIQPQTEIHSKAQAFLKDFAHFAGDTVIQQQQGMNNMQAQDHARRKRELTGLIPTDQQVAEVDTNPENKQFAAELTNTANAIEDALVAGDVRAYLNKALLPRFEKVKEQYHKRRAGYPTEEDFLKQETPLIDFTSSFYELVGRALHKARVAEAFAARTEDLRSYFKGRIETLSGQDLEDFYTNQLKPKFLSLSLERHKLTDPEQLQEQDMKIEVIRAAVKGAFAKLESERAAAKQAVTPTMEELQRMEAEIPAFEEIVIESPSLKQMQGDDDLPVLEDIVREDDIPVLTEVVEMPLSRPVEETAASAPSPVTPAEIVAPVAKPEKAGFLKRAFGKAVAQAAAVMASIGLAFALSAGGTKTSDDAPQAPTQPAEQAAARPQSPDLSPPLQISPAATEEKETSLPEAKAPAHDVTRKTVRTATVHTSFAPAAQHVVEESKFEAFDISTSRMGSDTWEKACDQLKKNRLENSICQP